MKRHIGIIILALLVFVVLLVITVAYVVDETKDIVLITTFGKITRVVDGHKAPGLHFKLPWPIQKLIRYDSRDHPLSSSYRQLQIGEKVNIMATVFCVWRIEDPEKFYRTKKTVQSADEALRALLSSEMTGVLGKIDMDELVNTDPSKMKLAEIDARIRRRVRKRAMEDYGIELSPVGGIRVLGLPQSVSKAVITAMTEERSKEISKYQAEGQATADAIIGRATAARDKILAFANRKATDIRTKGEAKAAETYAKVNEHPEFSMFLRSLESLRTSLKNRTVFFLDPDTQPILRWLREKPSLKTFEEKK